MRGERGFTLIELLIVVAIIGIIAAMAIPNLMNAVDKAKQKRTVADIRQLGGAVEMYAVDNNTYPRVSSFAALSPLIQPTYVKTTAGADGWSHAWIFTGDTSNGIDYTLTSLAKDGVPSAVNFGPTKDFDCDIVFSNGQFFQWPDGSQT